VAGKTVPETDQNGNVSYWSNPTIFFEYDPTTKKAAKLPIQPPPLPSPNPDTWTGRLLLLPNGQVLYTSQQNTIVVYSPDGQASSAWKPVITACPQSVARGTTFTLSGRQLNGLSQAVAYGDDYAAATNYPLVRLQQGTRVRYCKTFNFSTLGVATGAAVVSTSVSVPADAPTGSCQLSVVANGIPSDSVTVNVH
jgi:hypothetical protein